MPIIDAEGTYRAKVISKEFCQSKAGKEQLAIGFEVVGDGPQAGHHITEFLSFSDAALPYTEKKMRTLGWQGIDVLDLSTLGSVEVDIVCAVEAQDGYEPRMRVKFINAAGSGPTMNTTPLDDGQKKAFAARMRAKLAGLNAAQARVAAKKPPQPAKREEPPPPSDDDSIPF